MEGLLDQLPSLGVNISPAQAAVVAMVIGMVKLVKSDRIPIPVNKKYKPWVVMGLAFVLTFGVSLLKGTGVTVDTIGLAIITGFMALGIHGFQKAHRKDDPRRP